MELGFIPLTNLRTYTGPENTCKVIPIVVQAHTIIKHSGLLTFLSCRIPVQGPLKPDIWCSYLHGYWNQQIVD